MFSGQGMNPVPSYPKDAMMPQLSDRDVVSSQVLSRESQAWINYNLGLPRELSDEIREALRQAHRVGWRAGRDDFHRQVDELRWNQRQD